MAVDFFIIGAQRCGTTYLYYLLDQHPEISMARPVRPEPKFFIDSKKYDRGYVWYQETFFRGYGNGKTLGEKSTSYIEYEKAAIRIAKYNPAAKFLIILRDPVQRALSNYRYSVENKVETLNFSQAILAEKERIASCENKDFSVKPYAYAKRGLYFNYIEKYLSYFPIEQFKVVQAEKLFQDDETYLSILRFLGVEEREVPSPGVVNSSEKCVIPVDKKTCEYLEQYFLESNKKLAKTFNIDLALWPCKV